MKLLETKMKAGGMLEIPADVCERLKLKEGDRVDFFLDDNGRSVRLLARNGKLSNLKGLFKHEGPPLDIDEAISEHLAEKQERINREWREWHEFQEWRKAKSARAAE
jgi:bifunctional DNA-binding transcriptional regulator/antitoxin component of YhaV-PrlF toxin-antitoxin module